MRTVQQGDRVQVHVVKRPEGKPTCASRGREPVEVTVGEDHRRLPGLGLALVGLAEGGRVQVRVPPEQAYGLRDPGRLRRVPRSRFPEGTVPTAGRWVHLTGRTGRRRLVRIEEVCDSVVVVDTNHPWAGRGIVLDVEVIAIHPNEHLTTGG